MAERGKAVCGVRVSDGWPLERRRGGGWSGCACGCGLRAGCAQPGGTHAAGSCAGGGWSPPTSTPKELGGAYTFLLLHSVQLAQPLPQPFLQEERLPELVPLPDISGMKTAEERGAWEEVGRQQAGVKGQALDALWAEDWRKSKVLHSATPRSLLHNKL